METGLLLIPGGVGLFLLGMSLMTGGLRALAGPALRRMLGAATSSPLRGAVSGVLATTAVQSSSATTVMAVGFVGAGLMTFPQALGVIFGANIGSTTTGWIVALLGFKLDLGLVATALLPVGALARILGKGRMREAGSALAGFALLFMGVEAMKDGAAGLEGLVVPESLPGGDALGLLTLVAAGALATVITQSSGAGMAANLAALGAGAVSLEQAAALAIGMDVGTTATALLATVGGSTAMRRTGAAHVIYNLMTAAMAFALLPVWVGFAERLMPGEPQLALVAFHTGFNTLGVALILPFAAPFARLIERLFPERAPPLARRLDPALLTDPPAASEAALATVADLAQALTAHLTGARDAPDLSDIAAAIDAAQRFAERMPPPSARRADALHALDHLERLARRVGQAERRATLDADRPLVRAAARLRREARGVDWRAPGPARVRRLNAMRRLFRRQRAGYRAATLAQVAEAGLGVEEAGRRLDAIRWLHRVAYHLWRIAAHLDAQTAPAADGNASYTATGDNSEQTIAEVRDV
ncbi:MAG: Na/Pi cotransporter family protein [Rubrimonas sp.]|uniref:Na/Pi cotransporter family protein n=1 Tax=Rubrimonas sp. TaxID=2036015 RepID=UPI002FDEC1C9